MRGKSSARDVKSKKRRRKTATPKGVSTLKTIPSRNSTHAKPKTKSARPTRGQGALDDLEVDYRTGEERWQSLLENPIFGVTFLSKDHRYEGTNQTFQTMVGYTGEELREFRP